MWFLFTHALEHIKVAVYLINFAPADFVIKEIKNGWPCIVEFKGMQDCALVGDLPQAIGKWRDVVKAQP